MAGDEFEEEGIMKLCDSGHDEICFDGGKCPFCEEVERSARLEEEIADLKEKIKELEEREG